MHRLVGAVELHPLRRFTILLGISRTSTSPLTLMSVLQVVGIRLGSEEQVVTSIGPQPTIIL